PARLGYAEVGVTVARVARAAVAATKVDFAIPGAGDLDPHAPGTGHHHGHGTHVGALLERIRQAPLTPWVREHALRAFELLAQAEARVHGTTSAAVHLHEVGATDAVLDIVGAVEGFEQLGVQDIYHLPIAVGSGWVRAAHGTLPVPAPATGLLLEGLDVRQDGPVTGEATTPTGAALLRALSRGRPPARWRLERSGWGAGTRDPAEYPNALRLLLGEAAAEAGLLDVITTDLDDMSPEYLEPLRSAALAAGAVECFAWTVQGKKGRVALRVEALAPADAADAVIAALLRHSTTAGIRRAATTRVTLPRREVTVELGPGNRVRVKVWRGPDGPRWKAEFEDVAAVASRLDRPAWRVAREAEALAGPMVQDDERVSQTEEQA
ncbi:MAG: LarC family nickel insertion protein, partial [Gemmatimonadota bacterium]|nr:LarC family nickel insertion protein [Gemmatimonadota bacterium]